MWRNNTRANVYDIIIGLAGVNKAINKTIFTGKSFRKIKHIDAYLTDSHDVIISSSNKPLFFKYLALRESSLIDWKGGSILSANEYRNEFNKNPRLKVIIRLYVNEKIINGIKEYCIWVPEKQIYDQYNQFIAKKVEQVKFAGMQWKDKSLTNISYKF
ncbi:type IIL restriction-modification enzyme MmeI [Lactobacillus panisapium]|uniref:type IIL restriction-modification enzyme MmeI n=1 Tax=Lactobacillus panisapium TaxID=2012495 RepID=UPI001FD35233|nr:type IIL restriction-modification enzyme MmeI [Lactobacillus panisapium]